MTRNSTHGSIANSHGALKKKGARIAIQPRAHVVSELNVIPTENRPLRMSRTINQQTETCGPPSIRAERTLRIADTDTNAFHVPRHPQQDHIQPEDCPLQMQLEHRPAQRDLQPLVYPVLPSGLGADALILGSAKASVARARNHRRKRSVRLWKS